MDPRDGMRDLGTLGQTESRGNGINALGQVTGVLATKSGWTRAFRWSPCGGMQDLGTFGGPAAFAVAINASGQVTGGVPTRTTATCWLSGGLQAAV
jgi:probable HAF family extracellular repeat protein